MRSTPIPDSDGISLVRIFVEEHLVAGNVVARGCAIVEINARLTTWLDVGVEKKRKK